MNKDGTFRFKIPQQLEDRLLKEQERTGLTRSDLIRRAVDQYLDKKETTVNLVSQDQQS